MKRKVLVVEDEDSLRHVLTLILNEKGYEVRAVGDGKAALSELGKNTYDVVITDVQMPEVGGMEVLAHVRESAPTTTVIVMSAYGSPETAIEAVKNGAYDYISKPFKPDEVVLVLRKAEERERLRRENERLKVEIADRSGSAGFENMVGDSAAMKKVFSNVRRIAEYNTTVLLTGESGTGKELIARAIHDRSPRKDGPFVPVNCGAIPPTLVESQLFGHVKGAFTDASVDRRGLIEEADQGTLFLDEIGEMPLEAQVALLRFLQEGEIRRVGDTATRLVDVRVVAATARDLDQDIEEGRFREDLYYRLNVVPVTLPPLRDRSEDIPALTVHLVERLSKRLGRSALPVGAGAMEVLRSYSWPGNVRQLENTLEQALVLSDADEIGVQDLPEKIRAPTTEPWTLPGDDLSIKKGAKRLEAGLIRRALEQTGGNRTKAAGLLEISHRALLYKIKNYGIDL